MINYLTIYFHKPEKAGSAHRNICKNPRKWFQRAGIIIFFKNWPTFNFMNGDHNRKKL